MVKFLYLMAFAATLHGQRDPARMMRAPEGRPAAPAAGAEPGSVAGTVTSMSGDLLRKAAVTLRGNGRGAGTFTRTTDASGTFLFDGVPAGSYTLSVQRNGYVRTDYGGRPGVRGSASMITINAGQRVTGITIRMVPHAVLAGKVIDEDGEALHHAMVQILRERWINGRRQLTPMNADSTNDLGEYRIAELPAGRFYLMANLGRPSVNPGDQPRAGEADMSYAPVFYPGVNDITQATPINLAAGQQMPGVDFQLRKVPMYRIRGRVLDEIGKPAAGTGIAAIPGDGSFTGLRSMGFSRGPEGQFEIAGVLPGSYTLVVNRATRGERGRVTGHLAVQVGARDLENVVLQMSRPLEVSGVIRMGPDATVPPNTRVTIEPLQPGAASIGGSETQMRPDGTFTLSGLSAGKYRFAVQNMPQGTYLKNVMVQGQDITGGAAINASAAGVEVTLGINAPELAGVVLNADRQPVPEARVVLVPESSKFEQYWLFRASSTDQNGAFTLQGIAPGHYTAYAFGDIEEGSWHSPETMKLFDGKGTTIKLSEGGKDSVQLTLVPQ